MEATKSWGAGMDVSAKELAGFIVIAIVVGAVWGTTMGYLANAETNRVSQGKRWAATAGTLVVALLGALLIQWVGDFPRASAATKGVVAVAFFGSIGLAMSRWKFKA